MNRPRLSFLLAAVLGLSIAASVSAETVSLPPAADTHLRSDQPNLPQDKNQLLLVGDTAAATGALRAVLRFDLGASIPAGAKIRHASLRLAVDSVDAESADLAEVLHLHLLQESFSAADATWTKRAAAELWKQPGGSHAADAILASASANPAGVRPGQSVIFDSADLTAAVVAQRDGQLDLLAKLANEDAQRTIFRFGSSRTKARAPMLLVEFDHPDNVSGVVPTPGHPEHPLSPRYRLTVGDRPVEVRAERFDFDVGMLCLPPAGAAVEVELSDDFQNYTLKPARHGIAVERNGRKLRFTLQKPLKLVLHVDALPPLAIIATPLETVLPDRQDPRLLYFPPGVTTAGVIRPVSGQTIYLAPGALVKGRIEAKNVSGVSIRGRGILDITGHSDRGKKTHGILFENSRDITVEGIGVRAFHTWWQTLFLNSRDILVSHLNLFGVGVNTDGVDIDGVRDFVVSDCFIRAEDDGLGWHSLDAAANGERNTERAVARDLVIWNTGAGNGIRIGASMETQLWRDILVENVDILMHDGAGIYSDFSDWAWCEDLTFRNITIEKPSSPIVFKILKTHYSNSTGFLDERGHIERLVFENVVMNGGRISLAGHDETHRIDRVYFNDCINAGAPLKTLAGITVNAHVTDVRFNQIVPPRPEVPAGRYEAEHHESSTNVRPQITYADPALSGGKGRLLQATATGDHVEYAVENIPAGAYRLKLGVKTGPASGRFRLSIDGAPVGEERDLFAGSPADQLLDFGDIELGAPSLTRTIRLTVSGKNPASGGHRLDVDFIELVPLPDGAASR